MLCTSNVVSHFKYIYIYIYIYIYLFIYLWLHWVLVGACSPLDAVSMGYSLLPWDSLVAEHGL